MLCYGKMRCLPVLTLLCAAYSRGGDSWPLDYFSADPKAVLDAAAKRAAPKDSNVFIVDFQATFRVDDNGQVSRKLRVLYRAVNDQGAKELSQMSQPWLAWRQEKPKVRVRVIAADGTAHDLDPATITEAGIPSQVQGVFTDAKVLSAPLPAVAANAVIETEFEIRDRETVDPSGVFERYPFSAQIAIGHLGITIDAPAKMELRLATQGIANTKRTETHQGERQQITLEASDLPAHKALPLAPPDHEPDPAIVFSTVASWQHVAQWYAATVDRQIAEPSFQPKADPMAKIQEIESILAEIQKTVRYTGVELGLAAFVPRAPQETLTRGYGDCKDKAALLVSRLRKAGIAANLALLTPYPSRDVAPDLPGVEAFSHAIVYVPGEHPLWIDPTSEFTPARRLPWADQARMALIADPSTTRLIRTPESKAGENLEIDIRTVDLKEDGKPALTEIHEFHGVMEDLMRGVALQLMQLPEQQRKDALRKGSPGAGKIESLDFGNPKDLTQPSRITVKMEGSGAVVNEKSASTLLPPNISRPAQLQGLAALVNAQEQAKDGEKRTEDYYLPDAFVAEERWHVMPPPGFKLKQLPKFEEAPAGSLTLRRTAMEEPDGSVLLTYRLESLKRSYSVAEAKLLVEGWKKVDGQTVLRLEFMPEGEVLMAAGKWKEGFAILRKDAEANPTSEGALLRYSSALLEAGFRDKAAEICEQALKANPKSARAYTRLSTIYRHDSIGRADRPGMKLDDAEKAIQKAADLDINDKRLIAERAVIKEWEGPQERRYADSAKLAEAIGILEGIAADLPKIQQQNQLAEALFYAHRFQDAKAFYGREEGKNARVDLHLAVIAAVDGAPAAIREAATLIADETARKASLYAAAIFLNIVDEHSKSADLFEAGSSAGKRLSSSDLAMLRRARVRTQTELSKNPAIHVVQEYIFALLDPDSNSKYKDLLTPEWREQLTYTGERTVLIRQLAAFTRLTGAATADATRALADIAVGNSDFVAEGNDAQGYRVRFSDPAANGAMKTMAWVVRRGGAFQILGLRDDQSTTGGEALALLKKGDLEGARQWLDWQNEEMNVTKNADPLAAEAFLKMWPPAKEPPSKDVLIAAAASLVARGSLYREGVDALNEVRGRTQDEAFKNTIDHAIATGLSRNGQFEEVAPVWQRLTKAFPTSESAFYESGLSLIRSRRADDASKLAEAVKPASPHYLNALRIRIRALQDQHKFAEAIALYRELCASNKAGAADWNNLGWLTLFVPGQPPETKAVETALRMTQERTLAYLHTMGSIEAELGHVKEARDLLLRYVNSSETVNDSASYLVGRIAEELGLLDLATDIYSKIPKPKVPTGDAAYDIAQLRLKIVRTRP